eukprot:TRINITY_DN1058_c0_g1_i1.p1 TRINITY_DN1058_c0_g1~~TRINITY_DN1058_c0_g1_i1.p1  ORF type:complete len:385 (-),score=36.60 TRINITY_DN1058_c0_g1_i1:36-1190(-)
MKREREQENHREDTREPEVALGILPSFSLLSSTITSPEKSWLHPEDPNSKKSRTRYDTTATNADTRAYPFDAAMVQEPGHPRHTETNLDALQPLSDIAPVPTVSYLLGNRSSQPYDIHVNNERTEHQYARDIYENPDRERPYRHLGPEPGYDSPSENHLYSHLHSPSISPPISSPITAIPAFLKFTTNPPSSHSPPKAYSTHSPLSLSPRSPRPSHPVPPSLSPLPGHPISHPPHLATPKDQALLHQTYPYHFDQQQRYFRPPPSPPPLFTSVPPDLLPYTAPYAYPSTDPRAPNFLSRDASLLISPYPPTLLQNPLPLRSSTDAEPNPANYPAFRLSPEQVEELKKEEARMKQRQKQREYRTRLKLLKQRQELGQIPLPNTKL